MKVVHINKKDIDKQKAYLEHGNEIMRKVAQREYQRYLRLKAKLEANKEAGLPTGIDTAKI